MPTRLRVFSSSVGTKLLIGATGLVLFSYLITQDDGPSLAQTHDDGSIPPG